MRCARVPTLWSAALILEQRRGDHGDCHIWSAYATHDAHDALDPSPFAIDPPSPVQNPWRMHFVLINQVAPHLLTAREADQDIFKLWFDELAGIEDGPHQVKMGDWGRCDRDIPCLRQASTRFWFDQSALTNPKSC